MGNSLSIHKNKFLTYTEILSAASAHREGIPVHLLVDLVVNLLDLWRRGFNFYALENIFVIVY